MRPVSQPPLPIALCQTDISIVGKTTTSPCFFSDPCPNAIGSFSAFRLHLIARPLVKPCTIHYRIFDIEITMPDSVCNSDPTMHFSATCHSFFPGFVCRYTDVLVYLFPSIVLAIVIQFLARKHPVFFLLTLAGTFCHELAHLFMGLITAAHPASMNLIPRRTGRGWELGSVTFRNLRWYNAAPTALAPLLIIVIPFCVALWRVHLGWQFAPLDIAIAFLLAPQFLSFWPSGVDWRIAVRSWPYLLIALACYWLWETSSGFI